MAEREGCLSVINRLLPWKHGRNNLLPSQTEVVGVNPTSNSPELKGRIASDNERHAVEEYFRIQLSTNTFSVLQESPLFKGCDPEKLGEVLNHLDIGCVSDDQLITLTNLALENINAKKVKIIKQIDYEMQKKSETEQPSKKRKKNNGSLIQVNPEPEKTVNQAETAVVKRTIAQLSEEDRREYLRLLHKGNTVREIIKCAENNDFYRERYNEGHVIYAHADGRKLTIPLRPTGGDLSPIVARNTIKTIFGVEG